MRKQLLAGALCCLVLRTQAQHRTDAVYAAPGMPLHMQRGVPTEAPRVRKPFLTEVMPRFWLEPDSVLRTKGLNQVMSAIRSRHTFPKAAMVDGVAGQILVRAILSPEGVPMQPKVVGRSSTFEAVDKKVVDVLDAETIRVVEMLRFTPKAGSPDTLTVPMSYFFQ